MLVFLHIPLRINAYVDFHMSCTEERLLLGHSAINFNWWRAAVIFDLVECSPISLLHLWSSATVIFEFSFTSLTKALLPQLFSLGGQPGLGRVLIVPNFFHFEDHGGHCDLWNLGCSRNSFVTLAISVPCHNSVSQLIGPHSHLL